MKKQLFAVIISTALLAVGCNSSDDDDNRFVVTTPQPAQAQAQVTVQQVEFLARPAIAEGLLFSNNALNTYNSVPPSFIAAALANPNSAQGQAAAPVLAEAVTVLNILTNLDGDPNDPLTTTQIVGAFLPDVMRIDTTLAVPVAASAYDFATNNVGSLVAGRKLTDDVIDITLNALTGGVVTSDGAPYYRPNGNTNPCIGHSNLNGQAQPFGPAQFPFLAEAN